MIARKLLSKSSIERAYQQSVSEHEHQCVVIRWRDTEGRTLPNIHLLFAVPNGGQRNRAVAGKLKAEGVLAGVSDLMLPVRRRGYLGLFLEMKRIGGRLTPAQVQFQRSVAAQGYCAVTCEGSSAAIGVLEWYYGLRDTLPEMAKMMETSE